MEIEEAMTLGIVGADSHGPAHYKQMGIEPWAVMESVLTREEWIGYLKGNIIRYAMRQGRKEGTDDVAKAKHYQQKLDEVLRDNHNI